MSPSSLLFYVGVDKQLPNLLHGQEMRLYGDSAYRNQQEMLKQMQASKAMVDEGLRGRGLGRRLMTSLFAFAINNGAKAVGLQVVADNSAAEPACPAASPSSAVAGPLWNTGPSLLPVTVTQTLAVLRVPLASRTV